MQSDRTAKVSSVDAVPAAEGIWGEVFVEDAAIVDVRRGEDGVSDNAITTSVERVGATQNP
jgi:hypothetical protein